MSSMSWVESGYSLLPMIFSSFLFISFNSSSI
nr:MAG TPA: hypothetical protein [Caudoviricetes sp.]